VRRRKAERDSVLGVPASCAARLRRLYAKQNTSLDLGTFLFGIIRLHVPRRPSGSYYPSRPGCGATVLLVLIFTLPSSRRLSRVQTLITIQLSLITRDPNQLCTDSACFVLQYAHPCNREKRLSRLHGSSHHPVLADTGLQSFSCLVSVCT
jgi:hypothetical protein